MIAQKSIVTPNYLEAFVKATKSQNPAPDPMSYLPPLAESQLDPDKVSFKANPKRAELFVGRIFIFLNTKQVCVWLDEVLKLSKIKTDWRGVI